METGTRAVLIYRINAILFEEGTRTYQWRQQTSYVSKRVTDSSVFPKKPIDQFTDEELVKTLELLIYYKFRSR